MPTRIFTNNAGYTSHSQIDYFATNIDESFYSETVKQPNISDHCGLIFSLNILSPLSISTPQYFYKREINHQNLNHLSFILGSETFQNVYEANENVFNAYSNFVGIIQ